MEQMLLAEDIAFAILPLMQTYLSYYSSLSAGEKTEFAERLGTSVAYLSQLANGHRNPGGKILRLIYSASGGQVSAESFFALPEQGSAA